MRLKTYISFSIAIILLAGCATSNQIYLNSARRTSDRFYGYSPKNPIIFNKSRIDDPENITRQYISRLSTLKDERFRVIQENKITNPMKERPEIREVNPETGKKYRYGTGPYIEEYILKAEKSNYTIKLYFNLNVSARKLQVPWGCFIDIACGE